MPRTANRGERGLLKRHREGCRKPADLARCGCPWRGRTSRGRTRVEVILAEWSRTEIDPRNKSAAVLVLRRFLTAVSENRFDPSGEIPVPKGGAETLGEFIENVYAVDHVGKHKLRSNSIGFALAMIAESRIGKRTLIELAGNSKAIEEWLDEEGADRKWSDGTWNDYHQRLTNIFKRAATWTIGGGKTRIATNPMSAIDRKRGVIQPEHFKQRVLVEDVEDRLFAVVDQLNRPQHRPTKTKITQATADAIRTALEQGTPGVQVARRFKVSPATVSQIKHGDIWNPENLRQGTKGTEMKRRLIGVFDGGLRRGEMMLLTIDHVDWRPLTLTGADGKRITGYRIVLPPEITKGGASTGEPEEVIAATDRFRHVLESRRFALRGNPASRRFIFGTEDGRYQKGFDRMWQELFALAGISWGRAIGVTWHTGRHEFINRIRERNPSDPVLAQKIARHRKLETTQLYFHTRRDEHLAAAASLNRSR